MISSVKPSLGWRQFVTPVQPSFFIRSAKFVRKKYEAAGKR